MLNPAELLPMLAILFALGLFCYAVMRYLDGDRWPTYQARHHRTASPHAEAYTGPWPTDIAGEPTIAIRPPVFDPLDHSIPLAEVEQWQAMFSRTAQDAPRELADA